jgi:hypothetical protein
MITILNTSILTNYGRYEFEAVTLERARELVSGGFQSAIGHQSTADILTDLLETQVMMNRAQYVQAAGDKALVFKLKGRVLEGVVLNREQIEEMGYEFGVLTRIS